MSKQEDLFDLLLIQRGISKSSVFDYLDEFTVYCYYTEQVLGPLNIEIEENFSSPLREDDTKGSFRLYYGKAGKLLFTDFGDKNKTGDVVDFVADLYKIHPQEALKKIVADFGLSDVVPTHKLPVRKKFIKRKKKLGIKIKPFTKEELAYWNSFHIGLSTLNRFNVFSVEYVFWDDVPVTPSSMCFAYRIGEFYKIYYPFDKENRFVSSFPKNYVEGMLQLQYKQDLLIITKSTKDVMVLYEMGYEAVSPKSENTVISTDILNKLKAHYKRIVVFFDNDDKHKADEYPFPSIELPKNGKIKDISDFAQVHGLLKAQQMLNQLLEQC